MIKASGANLEQKQLTGMCSTANMYCEGTTNWGWPVMAASTFAMFSRCSMTPRVVMLAMEMADRTLLNDMRRYQQFSDDEVRLFIG